jgi:hypothetical protein
MTGGFANSVIKIIAHFPMMRFASIRHRVFHNRKNEGIYIARLDSLPIMNLERDSLVSVMCGPNARERLGTSVLFPLVRYLK